MNWLIIISNIAFAVIAALLCVLSWKTLKKIKRLNVGKSFWLPVLLSGFLFAICSIIAIFNETIFSSTIAVEINQVTQLIAFCFLSVGVYGYSRMIRKNLPAEYLSPDANFAQKGEMPTYAVSPRSYDKDAKTSGNTRTEAASECNHQLGYLSTFPENSSLPEECLSCNKVMECKHP
jgi:hypothetical protein